MKAKAAIAIILISLLVIGVGYGYWRGSLGRADDLRAELKEDDRIAMWLYGPLDEIRSAIESGADVNAPITQGTQKSKAPLILAAQHGRSSDTILLLLDAGADPRATDSTGRTALDYILENKTLRDSQARARLEQLTRADEDDDAGSEP